MDILSKFFLFLLQEFKMMFSTFYELNKDLIRKAPGQKEFNKHIDSYIHKLRKTNPIRH